MNSTQKIVGFRQTFRRINQSGNMHEGLYSLPVVGDWPRYQCIHQQCRAGGKSCIQNQEVNGDSKAAEAQWDEPPVKRHQRSFGEVQAHVKKVR
jgi:hypothetical protein